MGTLLYPMGYLTGQLLAFRFRWHEIAASPSVPEGAQNIRMSKKHDEMAKLIDGTHSYGPDDAANLKAQIVDQKQVINSLRAQRADLHEHPMGYGATEQEAIQELEDLLHDWLLDREADEQLRYETETAHHFGGPLEGKPAEPTEEELRTWRR